MDLGARLERAEQLGHRLEQLAVTAPPAAAGAAAGGISAATAFHAPVQRVKTRSMAKKKAATADRLKRWRQRSEARKAKARFLTGRYTTSTGPITISGLHNQRMTQARMGDYGNQTFGSLPPYAHLRAALPPQGERALYTKLKPSEVRAWTHRQRLAASLTAGLQHGSENDRAPGFGKLVRALARQFNADSSKPHPLDVAVNPAVSTADEARDLMSGTTALNAHQQSAIEGYASDSSDDDDDDMPLRTGLLKRTASS